MKHLSISIIATYKKISEVKKAIKLLKQCGYSAKQISVAQEASKDDMYTLTGSAGFDEEHKARETLKDTEMYDLRSRLEFKD